MMTGQEPGEIDHQDGVCTNNSFDNLRAATRTQNVMNRCRKSGKTLPKGVHEAKHGRFHAQIRINSKTVHIGAFSTPAAAAAAYMARARKEQGSFAVHEDRS